MLCNIKVKLLAGEEDTSLKYYKLRAIISVNMKQKRFKRIQLDVKQKVVEGG